METPQIHVRAAGMVSALGEEWQTGCAAAHAGLRRAAAIVDYENQSEIDGEDESIVGHSATLITHGFEGGARLLRLLAGGLRDLRRGAPEVARHPAGVGYYLALGPRDRIATAAGLIADPEVARSRAAERADAVAPDDDEDAQGRRPAIESDPSVLLARAAALAGFGGTPQLRACVEQGSVAGLVALEQARAELTAGIVRHAIVVAVDTLLPPAVLEWLEATGRLKSSDMPVGLEPGEACAALLLDAASDGAPALAVVKGIEFAVEPQPLDSGKMSSGRGTAAVLQGLAKRSGWGQASHAWIVSDANGEAYRAYDLGIAIVQARSSVAALAQAATTYPALGFGDVGAARALVAACTVLAAFRGGYAPAPDALVLAVGECHRRAGVVLARH